MNSLVYKVLQFVLAVCTLHLGDAAGVPQQLQQNRALVLELPYRFLNLALTCHSVVGLTTLSATSATASLSLLSKC